MFVLETKIRTQLVNAIKRVWRNSPQRKEVDKRCQHPTDKNLRVCESCFGVTHKKLFEIDHIDAIGGIVIACKHDWNMYLTRVFTNPLQGLCPECHKPKTEDDKRRAKGLTAPNAESAQNA